MILFTVKYSYFIPVHEPQPRAAKRIRLSASEMSFEEETTLLQQIIMKISTLLGSKDSTDFHLVMKSAKCVVVII